jgi:AraC-like DNA-binding protein
MSLTSLATALAMSTRTLQRHLKSHELCFSDLLDRERKRRFAQFCAVMGKQALSDLLGYTEQASLNRAVKRWYGISPSAYVKRLHWDNRR